ncbi:MAG: hypothetical protein WKG07_45295 [Hymenobacter sp.]
MLLFLAAAGATRAQPATGIPALDQLVAALNQQSRSRCNPT